jgi:L-ribulose-5-phosphate 4-epimerase
LSDLQNLKRRVLEANKRLKSEGLIISSWGNVSEYDRESGLIAIKASGVPYDDMTTDDIAVVDLNGAVIGSNLRPSTDCATHLVLYKRFQSVQAIVHTHSMYATIWAQAGKDIPILGTTHADYFAESIPCTRNMTKEEIEGEYEKNTGEVIVERFQNIDPLTVQAVLVHSHGTFVWGRDAHEAVTHAVILEFIAKMAWCNTVMADSQVSLIDSSLKSKHYNRKYGPNAYYGQRK